MKVHMIGVGGIGMSGLARVLLEQGVSVSGSDCSDGPAFRKIRSTGARVRLAHASANVDHPDVVVYSSAITPENPELIAARNRGIPVLHRGQLLAELVAGRRTVAVAGAHGKSTTSAMAAQLLVRAGLDPMLLLGAEVESLGGSARMGRGAHAVVETDESDGSFLWLNSFIGIITNVDDEHLDYFRNRAEIKEAYAAFAERVRPDGTLIGCADDPSVRKLLVRTARSKIGYGLSRQAQIRAAEVHLEEAGSRYRCLRGDKTLGTVHLNVPGLHNVVNSLAAVAVGEALGLEFRLAQEALAEYRGAKRRFQIHGEERGVLVVEDYGHHPTEIRVTIEAARGWPGRKIRCLFQPHRYSRTRYLMDRFASAFAGADEVILLPIYAASEEPVEGATGDLLYRKFRAAGRKKVKQCDGPRQALDYLERSSKPGDTVLFLGAGSVGQLAGRFLKKLK
jgi:UDP-N-acetylmuramate--alanine ligase